MAREAIPSWFYVIMAVRRGNEFLMVHEAKHGQLWYMPAGRVEPGENFIEAAKRETLEEGGIEINVTGFVRLEHTPSLDGSRMRIILCAEPIDDREPKSVADSESLEAGWFTLEEIKQLPLRGQDVLKLFTHLESGADVYPIEKAVSAEGAIYL